MRKLYLFILLVVVFIMTSCLENYYVSSETTFKNAIRSVQSQMATLGYEYKGFESYFDKGQASLHGVQQANTYRFADSLGNTISFTIVFAEKPYGKVNHVFDFEFCDCEVSDPKDYELFCGDVGMVRRMLPNNTNGIPYKKEDLESAVGLVQSKLEQQGFRIIGNKKTTNEQLDDGENIRNRKSRIDTHCFIDSLGNTLCYSVRYEEHQSFRGAYVNNVQLIDCEASNAKDGSIVCGEAGVVEQMLDLTKEQKRKRLTRSSSIMMLSSFGLLVFWLMPLILKLY